jgi:N-acetylglucosamine-6-sulfatase
LPDVDFTDGYNLGQFRVDSHKTMIYDHTTRVPMLIKGPGISPGSSFDGPASMADIAPTILQLAGGSAEAREAMDGKSFAPALSGAPLQWKDAVLVE